MKQPEFNTAETKKETKFHGAFLYIERVDKLLKGLDEITFQRGEDKKDILENVRKNFRVLCALYKELEAKMLGPERKEHAEALVVLTAHYNMAVNLFKKERKFNHQIYRLFDEWEIQLRGVMEKRGLSVPYKEDDGGL